MNGAAWRLTGIKVAGIRATAVVLFKLSINHLCILVSIVEIWSMLFCKRLAWELSAVSGTSYE